MKSNRKIFKQIFSGSCGNKKDKNKIWVSQNEFSPVS